MKLSRLSERLDRMPMLKAVVPFAAGIALGGSYTLPLWFLSGAFVLTGAAALLLRSSLCMLSMLLTAGFASTELRGGEPAVPRNIRTTYEIRIESIPSERGAYRSADAAVTAWRSPTTGKWHAAGDRITVRTDSLTPLAAGERLICRGYVRPFRGGSESYRRLMARRGFAGTLWIAEPTILERRPQRDGNFHIQAAARLARLPMDPDAGAVVRAMAAGDRSAVTPELRTAYSRSGFSHLLAVSGLHTGIVFLIVNLLLGWLPLLHRGHLVRNIAAAAAIWVFVAAAGFPPSAVRAAVMCTLLQFALASASEYSALNALATAAFGMLLWNPAWLGDISFQLSYIAVAAILCWGVPLCRRCRTRRRVLNAVIDAYLIGLAASAATAPLVSHTFGILPLAGLLLNPAAIALSGGVVLGGVLWMLLPFGALAPTFAFVLEHLAGAINFLARLTASLPYGAAEYTLGGGATGAVYLFFAAATLVLWSTEPKKNVHLPL